MRGEEGVAFVHVLLRGLSNPRLRSAPPFPQLETAETESLVRLSAWQRELRSSLAGLRWKAPGEGRPVGPAVVNCALCKVRFAVYGLVTVVEGGI